MEEHEKYICHRNCVQSYDLQEKNSDTPNLMSENLISKRREQVANNRYVMEKIIDVLKITQVYKKK